MRKFIDIITEARVAPETDPILIDKAAKKGFDVENLYFHGTKRQFSQFKLPKKKGIDELGRGVYLTSFYGVANVWSLGAGQILVCAIRKGGKIVELTKLTSASLWRSGPEHDDQLANPLWREAYEGFKIIMKDGESSPGANDAHGGYRDFAERINSGHLSATHCLQEVGYMGATSRDGQIRGQVVIWHPKDVCIVGRMAGVDDYVHDYDD